MRRNPQPVSRRGVGKRVIAALFASAASGAPQSPQDPQDDLSLAREANRKNGKLILDAKLPSSTEPSFRFEP